MTGQKATPYSEPAQLLPPWGAGETASGLKKSQQVGVDLVFQRRAHAVGRTRIDLESRIFDDLG